MEALRGDRINQHVEPSLVLAVNKAMDVSNSGSEITGALGNGLLEANKQHDSLVERMLGALVPNLRRS